MSKANIEKLLADIAKGNPHLDKPPILKIISDDHRSTCIRLKIAARKTFDCPNDWQVLTIDFSEKPGFGLVILKIH